MSRNFLQSLIAVVVGNVVYLLCVPILPEAARHIPRRVDIGLLVDFWFCVVALGLVRMAANHWRKI